MANNPYAIPYSPKPIDITTGQLGVPIYQKRDLTLGDTSYNMDLNNYDPNQLYNINRAYGNAGNNYNKYTTALQQSTDYKDNMLPKRNEYVSKLNDEIKNQEEKYKSDINAIDQRNIPEINRIQSIIDNITNTWIPNRVSSSEDGSHNNSNWSAPIRGYTNPADGSYISVQDINNTYGAKINELKNQYNGEKEELLRKLNSNKQSIARSIEGINQGTVQQTNDVNSDINTATNVLPTLGIADKIKLDRERYLDALESKTKQNQSYGQSNPYLKALI